MTQYSIAFATTAVALLAGFAEGPQSVAHEIDDAKQHMNEEFGCIEIYASLASVGVEVCEVWNYFQSLPQPLQVARTFDYEVSEELGRCIRQEITANGKWPEPEKIRHHLGRLMRQFALHDPDFDRITLDFAILHITGYDVDAEVAK